MGDETALGRWLKERCQQDRLSLR
ncbi:hypothetical protein LCGC14_2000810, partial [marine sediment metagenome]